MNQQDLNTLASIECEGLYYLQGVPIESIYELGFKKALELVKSKLEEHEQAGTYGASNMCSGLTSLIK